MAEDAIIEDKVQYIVLFEGYSRLGGPTVKWTENFETKDEALDHIYHDLGEDKDLNVEGFYKAQIINFIPNEIRLQKSRLAYRKKLEEEILKRKERVKRRKEEEERLEYEKLKKKYG